MVHAALQHINGYGSQSRDCVSGAAGIGLVDTSQRRQEGAVHIGKLSAAASDCERMPRF